jgi:hypothetical protein
MQQGRAARAGDVGRLLRTRAGAAVALAITAMIATGTAPAPTAASERPSEAAAFAVARDRGIVGSFGGYGGQMNQHVYAKISGPPPFLPQLEQRVVALQPQFVRIFFSTTEWQNPDRLESFDRTVRLADRAGADIDITWQGSTFEFAMRNMDRFAAVLAGLVEDGSIDHLWVTMFNEPNTTQRTLAEYEQVYRSLDRELRALGARDRVRFMGGDLVRSTIGPSRRTGSGTWRARWATCSTHGRSTCTGTSGTPGRSTSAS